MHITRRYLIILAMTPLFTGCVAVSLHSTRPVEVRVTEREAGKPVSRALIKVHYAQPAGYGVYYVLRIPKPETARTDANGIAIIPLATFSHSIIFTVNGERFYLNKKLIRQGGTPEGQHWKGPIIVQLTPKE